MTTVYITKYALTGGVFSHVVRGVTDDMVVVDSDGGSSYYHGKGKDWHDTLESAIARAETMRWNKIARLKKQLAKLEGFAFDKDNLKP